MHLVPHDFLPQFKKISEENGAFFRDENIFFLNVNYVIIISQNYGKPYVNFFPYATPSNQESLLFLFLK